MPKVRKKLVIGNWKLHGGLARNEALLLGIRGSDVMIGVDAVVCPPFPYLHQAAELLRGTSIMVGAQDLSAFREGAYTGEVAGEMLVDLGCRWVILGHSERRQLFGDTDAVVAAKADAALKAGLVPVLCVGESRAQRESGSAEAVVAAQLEAIVSAVGVSAFSRVVVAYEPIWAIGTGLTATPDQAQAMHFFIRNLLERIGVDAQEVRILYGGSVNAGNAARLFDEKDIDGALVGGASLLVDGFLAICGAASAAVAIG